MRDVTVQQLVSENDIEIGDNYSIVTGSTDMTFKEIGITLKWRSLFGHGVVSYTHDISTPTPSMTKLHTLDKCK